MAAILSRGRWVNLSMRWMQAQVSYQFMLAVVLQGFFIMEGGDIVDEIDPIGI